MEKTPDSDDHSNDGKKTTGGGTGSYHGESLFAVPPERPKQPIRQGMIFERIVQHDVGPGAPSESKPSEDSGEKEKDSKDKKKQSQWPSPYIPRVPLSKGPAIIEMPKSVQESAEVTDNKTEEDTIPTVEAAPGQVPTTTTGEHATLSQPTGVTGHEATRRVTDDNWSEWSQSMRPEPLAVLKRRIPGFPGPVAKDALSSIHTPNLAAQPTTPTEAVQASAVVSHEQPLPVSGEHSFEQPQESLFDSPLGPAPPEVHNTGNVPPHAMTTEKMPPGNLPPTPNDPHFFNSDPTPHFANTALNPNVGPLPPATIGNQAPETWVIEKGSGWGPALAVGLVERHYRRKEDKKLRKQNDKLAKQQTVNQESQQRMERAQNEMNTRVREQQQTMRHQVQQERLGGVAAPFGVVASPNSAPNINYAGTPNRLPVEQRPAQPAPIQEAIPQPDAQTVEQAADYATEQPARVVQDAWRRYRVDKHNREIVSTEGHGQAFREERQQEVLPDRTTAIPTQRRSTHAAGAAPTLGAFAAFGHAHPQPVQQVQPGQSTLPSGMTTPSLPQGMPTRADAQHQLPATDKAPSHSVPGVWFWVMLGIIIAAFFAAALI